MTEDLVRHTTGLRGVTRGARGAGAGAARQRPETPKTAQEPSRVTRAVVPAPVTAVRGHEHGPRVSQAEDICRWNAQERGSARRSAPKGTFIPPAQCALACPTWPQMTAAVGARQHCQPAVAGPDPPGHTMLLGM
jgi:hypothetical protein